MKTSKIVIKNLFGIRETTLDGKSVEISGPKGAGKTSVLDAIRFALTNRSERDCIVHQGADEGEIIIETTTGLSIDRKALPAKSAGTVKVRDGSLLQTRPAEFLSQIFTPLQLNPVEFTQLSRQEKNRVILSLIEFDWDVNWIREQFGEIPQGVDYSKHILEVLNDIQAENGVYFQSRQNINRDIRNKQAFISDIAKDIPSGYDYDRWNQYPIGDRYRELERLREKNSVIERAKAFRANFTSKLRGLEGSRDVEIGAIDRDIAAERAALTGSIERMKAELQATEEKLAQLSRRRQDRVDIATANFEAAILTYWTWSGDKSTISRQLTGEVAYIENSQLPVPEIGDLVTMTDGGEKKFVGIVLQRSLGSEDSTMAFTAFDYGYYLQRNDGTYKFTGATPEEMTRLACADRGIPIAQMPHTGIPLRRKFTGVKLNQLITTAWTLASEKNGKVYAIRYTPAGLLVKERTVSTSSLVLKAASNLMNATTKEDATQMVNSVAIYDQNGNFLRRMGDSEAQKLCGVMEQHVTQGNDGAARADASAKKILADGKLQKTVTVNVLGDMSLLTGETVVVREGKTGLTGIFWIDADVHTWKNKNYYTKLTLNCRNVMATADAGSEVK